MGKRKPMRPAHAANLTTMIAHGIACRGICDRCRKHKDVDLTELAALKGGDYSLWNRRTRCKLTPECGGWVRFFCNGRFRFEVMRD